MAFSRVTLLFSGKSDLLRNINDCVWNFVCFHSFIRDKPHLITTTSASFQRAMLLQKSKRSGAKDKWAQIQKTEYKFVSEEKMRKKKREKEKRLGSTIIFHRKLIPKLQSSYAVNSPWSNITGWKAFRIKASNAANITGFTTRELRLLLLSVFKVLWKKKKSRGASNAISETDNCWEVLSAHRMFIIKRSKVRGCRTDSLLRCSLSQMRH